MNTEIVPNESFQNGEHNSRTFRHKKQQHQIKYFNNTVCNTTVESQMTVTVHPTRGIGRKLIKITPYGREQHTTIPNPVRLF